MDKNKLKIFAIESRRQLIEDTTYQANLLGITKDGIQDPIEEAEGMQAFDIGGNKPYVIYDDDIEKRANLVKEVQDKGFENVIEEVAYTWFNRIIAIRYMEVNDYLPTRVRVLSSETLGKSEPDIIKEAFNIDLNLTNDNIQYIYKLKEENKNDELFQFLFIKQCNKLNEILPELFEKTQDYTELLLNIPYTNSKGIIQKLINNISEDDLKNQVEIIGWLYQFYNTELKEETFKKMKKSKFKKTDIPSITQLFTPEWIVRYMVDNSLGRLWINNYPNSNIIKYLKYYIPEAQQEQTVLNQFKNINQEKKDINPEDIKIIDPCMGSGHILIYSFELLINIYESRGYSSKDACVKILENNIYGLDIDNRAYQLSYFSIMMLAKSYDKQIFNKNISPNLYSINETNKISRDLINFVIANGENIENDINYIINTFRNAKDYGSILKINKVNFEEIYNALRKIENSNYQDMVKIKLQKDSKFLYKIVKEAEILYQKYDIVVTNPPYMNIKKSSDNLKTYIKKEYPLHKTDMYSLFIEVCDRLTKNNGFYSMIVQQSFMFLSTFEEFRKEFLKNNIINMVHLGTRAFEEIGGEVVQTVTFTKQKSLVHNYISKYIKLIDFSDSHIKEKEFFNLQNVYLFNQDNFYKLPGSPITYWADDNLIDSFNNGKKLIDLGDIKQGLATADNNRFLRYWFEVNNINISFDCDSCDESKSNNFKWFPYNKGGYYRKWYGNQNYVINWENNGYELKNFKNSVLRNKNYYFNKSVSWSKVSSGNIAFRFYPTGFLFDVAGCSVFLNNNVLNYIFGFLNSNVSKNILDCISPTLNYEVGHISSLPIIFNEDYKSEINDLVNENISLCKSDWDDYEVSWNFKVHPFIKFKDNNLNDIFDIWSEFKNNQFNQLKSNEIKLNQIYNEIYEVEYNCSIQEKYVSINKVNKKDDVESFLSYFVGCLFGRYSLDEEGLVFAGGMLDLGVYSCFVPDGDNIVPVLDSEYFDDDVVGRFVEFVKVAFGEESLEDNLDFIAGALKNKGSTSREVIRSYFLNDFFKDHVKMYKKCPIYWLFDSGKEDGFKCLVYMHRYSPDLVARVRTDYLHKTQKAIESQISYEQNIKENSGNSKDQARADKRIKKLTKQLDETRRYDEALAHVASQNISIDLDDGVKVNYAKFQNVEVSKEGQKVKKINLLKKI